MNKNFILKAFLMIIDDIYINLDVYGEITGEKPSKIGRSLRFHDINFEPTILNSIYYKKKYWVKYNYAVQFLNNIENETTIRSFYLKYRRNEINLNNQIIHYTTIISNADKKIVDNYYSIRDQNSKISIIGQLDFFKTYILFKNLERIDTSLRNKFFLYYKYVRDNLDNDKFKLLFITHSFSSFENKYSKFLKEGFEVLIHGNFNNKNASKEISVKEKESIKREYKNGTKISIRQILFNINKDRVYKGLKKLSFSTINKYIQENDNFLELFINRNGTESIEKMMLHPARIQPNLPGAVFQMDGTRLNFIVLNEENKPIFYNIVVIIDVFSKFIVDFKLTIREHFRDYRELLNNIILKYSHFPSEIVIDNLSSFKSTEALNYFKLLNDNNCIVRYHSKLTPQDKGHVENWFNLFGSIYLKKVYGYLGDGIKSKLNDGKPNNDLLKKYRNKSNYYTFEQINSILKSKIDEYNANYPYKNSHPRNLFNSVSIYGSFLDKMTELRLEHNYKVVLLDKAYIRLQMNNEICEYPIFKDNLLFFSQNFLKNVIVFFNIENTDYIYVSESRVKNPRLSDGPIKLQKHNPFPLAKIDQTKETLIDMESFLSKRNLLKKHLKNKINNDVKLIEKSKSKSLEEIKILPLELIDDSIDNKSKVLDSINASIEEDGRGLKYSLENLYKIQGSNKLIN